MSEKLDLVGQRFTRLLVIEFAYVKTRNTHWRCLCDCGNITIVSTANLKGSTKSCGCLRKQKHSEERRKINSEGHKGKHHSEESKRRMSEARRGKYIINLTGRRFGRLVVKEEAGRNNQDRITWLCKCDCGNEKIIVGHALQNGDIKSCGCYKKELMFRKGKDNPLFGKRGKDTPNYNPNLTDEDRINGRNIPGYLKWREAVLKRDNYTCQKCGKKGGNLNVHHVESYHDNPKLRTKLSNGITLCEDNCHRKFHHQYGYGHNNRLQLEEFLNE